jgi:hypothetical protein
MLPLKPGYPDMEIKEHHIIVFHMAETLKDGLTTFVTLHIILFVRVISVYIIMSFDFPFVRLFGVR